MRLLALPALTAATVLITGCYEQDPLASDMSSAAIEAQDAAPLLAEGAWAEGYQLAVAGRYGQARAVLGGDAEQDPESDAEGFIEMIDEIEQSRASGKQNLLAELGFNCLMFAATDGDVTSVRVLLDDGLDVNASLLGFTPLHNAAADGRLEVVLLLLDRGATVDAPGSFEVTPLMMAVGGNPSVVRLLIERGADVNAVNSFGVSVLEQAEEYDDQEGARILRDAGAN